MIEIKNASFKKNEIEVLRNINFRILENQKIFISGPTGSGKTMLLNALSGSLFPSNGKIEKDRTKRIVLVPRDYSFHRIIGGAYQYYQQRYNANDAEVGPNLLEVLQDQIQPLGTVNENSVDSKSNLYSETEIEEVARLFEIIHLLDRKITALSNGETRRSLLAHSFLKKPDLMLLDDPFSGLDTENRQKLKSILSNVKRCSVIIAGNKRDLPTKDWDILDMKDINDAFEEKLTTEVRNFPILNKPKTDFKEAVKLVNAQVKYGSVQVLKNVNWTIKKSEKWALLGPNGSGKSSLLSLITGDNLQCYSNELYIFDKKRGGGESIWDLKKNIGFMSPELHLYYNKQIRIKNVVASGLFDTMSLLKTMTEIENSHLGRCLAYFGLSDLKERKMAQVSFGEQRLALLARALIKNPALLILDEPCQGLDYDQNLRFKEVINKIVAEQDITLLYVAHYTEEIPECVEKTLFLENRY